MKRGCCVAEQIKRQTVRGEEEGDSDEMMLKGNEGAEGEETRWSRRETEKQTNKQEEKWLLPGEMGLSKVLVAFMSLTPPSSLETLSCLTCVASGSC